MKALEFLQKSRVFYLGTVDGNQARVRPLGFVMKYEGQLAFTTSSKKSMSKQMTENPNIEICSIDENLNTLRISGKAKFITSEDTQTKAIEIMPDLGKMYSVGSDDFQIFTIDNPQIQCYGMNGKKVDIEL